MIFFTISICWLIWLKVRFVFSNVSKGVISVTYFHFIQDWTSEWYIASTFITYSFYKIHLSCQIGDLMKLRLFQVETWQWKQQNLQNIETLLKHLIKMSFKLKLCLFCCLFVEKVFVTYRGWRQWNE